MWHTDQAIKFSQQVWLSDCGSPAACWKVNWRRTKKTIFCFSLHSNPTFNHGTNTQSQKIESDIFSFKLYSLHIFWFGDRFMMIFLLVGVNFGTIMEIWRLCKCTDSLNYYIAHHISFVSTWFTCRFCWQPTFTVPCIVVFLRY